jgi:hypothetical protein
MKQITISQEKKMTTKERLKAMPYEVTADGQVIGVFQKQATIIANEGPSGLTQCPNCKLKYKLPGKDKTPNPFSLQRHPKGI